MDLLLGSKPKEEDKNDKDDKDDKDDKRKN
jgi:hypothetical protein